MRLSFLYFRKLVNDERKDEKTQNSYYPQMVFSLLVSRINRIRYVSTFLPVYD